MSKINNYILIVIALLISSCSPSKRGITKSKNWSESDITQAINKHNINADWISYEADADIEHPELSIKGQVTVRIKSDSLVWIVAKKLGFEGIRVLGTPNKMQGILRTQQTYFDENWNGISDMLSMKMSYEDLQDIMSGRVILPKTNSTVSIDNNANADIGYLFEVDGLSVKHYLNAQDLQINRSIYTSSNGMGVEISYSNYKNVDGQQKFPYWIKVIGKSGAEIVKIEMVIKEVEINVTKNTPFSIPSHYEKMD